MPPPGRRLSLRRHADAQAGCLGSLSCGKASIRASTAGLVVGIKAALRRTVSIFILMFAWLCANGSVWDAMQVVAWGKMFADYAQTLSLGQSFRETMDPDKPCSLCLAISKARAAANQHRAAAESVAAQGWGKLLFTCPDRFLFCFWTTTAAWGESPSSTGPERTDEVPLPPPRAAVG